MLKTALQFAVLLTLQFGCNSEVSKDPLIKNNNAIWTEAIYLKGIRPSTNERLTDEQIEKYCNNLKKFHIKYTYLFAGPYQQDGHLPLYPFSNEAIRTVERMKYFYPELKILPWIGGIQNKNVYLSDSTWVNNAVEDTRKLFKTLRCDGVHIDLEFILKENVYLSSTIREERPGDKENYGTDVNKFHKKLREVLPTCFISSVVTSTGKNVASWKRKTSMEELEELIKYVDQISFLYYDTHISSQSIFDKDCLSQIQDIKVLKSKKPTLQCLIAIGTFVNEPMLQTYRDLNIENIPNSLSIIRKNLHLASPNSPLLDGISIFCDWETEPQEWSDFFNGWVRYGL